MEAPAAKSSIGSEHGWLNRAPLKCYSSSWRNRTWKSITVAASMVLKSEEPHSNQESVSFTPCQAQHRESTRVLGLTRSAWINHTSEPFPLLHSPKCLKAAFYTKFRFLSSSLQAPRSLSLSFLMCLQELSACNDGQYCSAIDIHSRWCTPCNLFHFEKKTKTIPILNVTEWPTTWISVAYVYHKVLYYNPNELLVRFSSPWRKYLR